MRRLNYTKYCTWPNKFLDRQIWANSIDPDQTVPQEQSDRGLHCLSFHLHISEDFYGKFQPYCSNCRMVTVLFSGVRIFRMVTVMIIILSCFNFKV